MCLKSVLAEGGLSWPQSLAAASFLQDQYAGRLRRERSSWDRFKSVHQRESTLLKLLNAHLTAQKWGKKQEELMKVMKEMQEKTNTTGYFREARSRDELRKTHEL